MGQHPSRRNYISYEYVYVRRDMSASCAVNCFVVHKGFQLVGVPEHLTPSFFHSGAYAAMQSSIPDLDVAVFASVGKPSRLGGRNGNLVDSEQLRLAEQALQRTLQWANAKLTPLGFQADSVCHISNIKDSLGRFKQRIEIQIRPIATGGGDCSVVSMSGARRRWQFCFCGCCGCRQNRHPESPSRVPSKLRKAVQTSRLLWHSQTQRRRGVPRLEAAVAGDDESSDAAATATVTATATATLTANATANSTANATATAVVDSNEGEGEAGDDGEGEAGPDEASAPPRSQTIQLVAPRTIPDTRALIVRVKQNGTAVEHKVDIPVGTLPGEAFSVEIGEFSRIVSYGGHSRDSHQLAGVGRPSARSHHDYM